jgi:hypothetical protein
MHLSSTNSSDHLLSNGKPPPHNQRHHHQHPLLPSLQQAEIDQIEFDLLAERAEVVVEGSVLPVDVLSSVYDFRGDATVVGDFKALCDNNDVVSGENDQKEEELMSLLYSLFDEDEDES